MNKITVIYDGECEFCKQSLTWLARKLELRALPFQCSDLAPFNLTFEQCAKQVWAIKEGRQYGGADAIALLLQHRGNTLLAFLIRVSGDCGRAGYRAVASHRNSIPVTMMTKVLKLSNNSYSKREQ
jgi:predicted DCC family thiol-disulfide oxidoreductase YuxK